MPNKAVFVKKQHNFPRNLPWTSHWFPEWVWYCSDPHDRRGSRTDSNGQPFELIPGVRDEDQNTYALFYPWFLLPVDIPASEADGRDSDLDDAQSLFFSCFGGRNSDTVFLSFFLWEQIFLKLRVGVPRIRGLLAPHTIGVGPLASQNHWQIAILICFPRLDFSFQEILCII